jgi:hypothetical protein
MRISDVTRKTLEQISVEEGMSYDERPLEILARKKTGPVAIYHAIPEREMECAMTHVSQTVESDIILGTFPHP